MSYVVQDGWIEGKLPGPGGQMVTVIRSPRGDQKPWSKLVRNPPHLCLHTTEGSTTLGDAYKRWLYPPNFACGDGKIVQLFPLGYASEATKAQDGHLLQVELAYRVANHSPSLVYLPPPSTLDPLVALTAFLHDEGFITTGLRRPNPDWPVSLDRGPQASSSYYRRNDGTWPKVGVYGHVDLPGDDHYDPASFDYPKFFEMVRAVLDPDAEEDVMFQEWKDGWDAHEAGKQINEAWPGYKKQGWRDRERVIREAVAQAKAP